jgi:hypothetical protein
MRPASTSWLAGPDCIFMRIVASSVSPLGAPIPRHRVAGRSPCYAINRKPLRARSAEKAQAIATTAMCRKQMGVERTIGAIRHGLRDFDAEQAVAGGQIHARRDAARQDWPPTRCPWRSRSKSGVRAQRSRARPDCRSSSMSKVGNRSVSWRPSEPAPSRAALLISTSRDRDGRFLLGPMLGTLFFMVGHKAIWAALRIVPLTQTTVTADQGSEGPLQPTGPGEVDW